jgi:hypothetical protein
MAPIDHFPEVNWTVAGKVVQVFCDECDVPVKGEIIDLAGATFEVTAVSPRTMPRYPHRVAAERGSEVQATLMVTPRQWPPPPPAGSVVVEMRGSSGYAARAIQLRDDRHRRIGSSP